MLNLRPRRGLFLLSTPLSFWETNLSHPHFLIDKLYIEVVKLRIKVGIAAYLLDNF